MTKFVDRLFTKELFPDCDKDKPVTQEQMKCVWKAYLARDIPVHILITVVLFLLGIIFLIDSIIFSWT